MSYFFRLPAINDLNVKQQNAINCVDNIILKGGPGTGKSVVTLYRHIRNCDQNKPGYLLTYHIPLCKYLQNAAKTHKNKDVSIHSQNINTTKSFLDKTSNFVIDSEIIIDETQDLHVVDYNRLKKMKVSYAIDGEQSTNLPIDSLKELQNELENWYKNNIEYFLDTNYRNSKEIIEFTRSLFPHKVIPHDIVETGPKPKLIYTSGKNQNVAIIDIIRRFNGPKHNIGILFPTGPEVEIMYQILDNEISEIPISKYYAKSEWLNEIQNVHITTFKSCKGLEFDTVIIPDFNKCIYKENRLQNENEIYVALTRTKNNLFIIDNRKINSHNLEFLNISINKKIIEIDNDYK